VHGFSKDDRCTSMHLGSKSDGNLLYAADSIKVSRVFSMLIKAETCVSLEMACSRPSCRAMTRCPSVEDKVVKPLRDNSNVSVKC